MALAIEVVASLDQLSLGSRNGGPRRSQAVQLVLRVEFGQHLVRLDMIANASQSLDDSTAYAEGESRLVFGLNLPREGDRFADSLSATVTVRTGRGSGALASFSSLHPESNKASAGKSSGKRPA